METRWAVIRETREVCNGEWAISKHVFTFETEELAREFLDARDMGKEQADIKYSAPKIMRTLDPPSEDTLLLRQQQMHIVDTLQRIVQENYIMLDADSNYTLLVDMLQLVFTSPNRDPALNHGDLCFVQGVLYGYHIITLHEISMLNHSMRIK